MYAYTDVDISDHSQLSRNSFLTVTSAGAAGLLVLPGDGAGAGTAIFLEAELKIPAEALLAKATAPPRNGILHMGG